MDFSESMQVENREPCTNVKQYFNYLNHNDVEKFVIIDDNLQFNNNEYNNFYVQPHSMMGLQEEHVNEILKVLL